MLDVQKDKKGGLPKLHNGPRRTVSEISENLDLVDAWRLLNPDTCRYTWRKKQPEVHCRLDFFLVSQSFMGNVSSADILPGLKTDHSLLTLSISSHSNPKGRGFWKLNTSFLKTGTKKKSSKLLEVPTANVNWQNSEPCVISTDVYFNTSGNKPEVYRRDKQHFLQFSLEEQGWQD